MPLVDERLIQLADGAACHSPMVLREIVRELAAHPKLMASSGMFEYLPVCPQCIVRADACEPRTENTTSAERDAAPGVGGSRELQNSLA